MITGIRALWGEDETREWLTAMEANGAVAYDNNSSIVAAVGAAEVVAGLVNHYYVFRFIDEQGESFPARNYFLPAGGPGSLIMVSGAGVLANAPHGANGQRFVEFLLSAEAQQYFADETFEYPVIDGVESSPLLTPLSELDAVAADVTLEQLADLEGTVALLSELGILP
jgi:iron(III) transport system substrate-binding protein